MVNVIPNFNADTARELSDEDRHKHVLMLLEQLQLLENTRGTAVSGSPAAPQSGLLGSAKFSDKVILEQICSTVYQLPLMHHNVPALSQLGPCFVAVAKAGLAYLQEPGSTKAGLGVALTAALRSQTSLPHDLVQHLCANEATFYSAMRVIAESYLDRGVSTAAAGRPKPKRYESDIVLKGSAGIYRPGLFIAEGSAGMVYAACAVGKKSRWAKAVAKELGSGRKLLDLKNQLNTNELVLKAIKPTQRDSAENEYRIAQKVATGGGDRYCVAYTDKIEDESGNLWLVLRRVHPSNYGIDMTDYIRGGFFQEEANATHAQSLVLQLLEGLVHIAACGVCMRDVKPDNVLVAYDKTEEKYTARWTDFGLAVDVSGSGAQLRRPTAEAHGKELEDQLVGWWYDSQKRVPKPKWKARTPPEQCYQALEGAAYDAYMTAVIFCCMAFGIDFPHLDKEVCKQRTEKALKVTFKEDYLNTFELGAAMKQHGAVFAHKFEKSFGGAFGVLLASLTELMLDPSPAARPNLEMVVEALRAVQGGGDPKVVLREMLKLTHPTDELTQQADEVTQQKDEDDTHKEVAGSEIDPSEDEAVAAAANQAAGVEKPKEGECNIQ